MSMKDRLHTGELYLPGNDEIMQDQLKRLDRLYDFNQTRPTEMDKRQALMKEMFAEIGEDCYIEPPFYSNMGAGHVHFGKGVYCNFGVTMVDDTHIYVGDYTMFGPNVTVATAGHPILPELREKGYQYNAPVHIGKNCWLGAGVLVLPGITIGDNVVVGAGSVVTKDLPSGVITVGNPCRVLREVNDHDREYYFKYKRIDWADIESNEKSKVPDDMYTSNEEKIEYDEEDEYDIAAADEAYEEYIKSGKNSRPIDEFWNELGL